MFFYNNLGIKILNYIGKTTVILMPRFMKFLTVDKEEEIKKERISGIGSTN